MREASNDSSTNSSVVSVSCYSLRTHTARTVLQCGSIALMIKARVSTHQ
jgi:hypothetical protein